MSEYKRPDGFYTGTITGARIEEDSFNDGGMVVVFTVDVDGDEYDCRHPDGSGDAKARERCEQVFAHLDLEFPKAMLDLSPCVGKEVRIRLKQNLKATRQNAYIATSKQGRVLTTDEINRRLNDDAVPF